MSDLIEAETARAHRISETMRCRRMRVLYGRGHTPDPTPPWLVGVYRRGDQIEQYGLELLRETLPEGTTVTPKKTITTPFGTGEIDFVVESADGSETFIYDTKSMRTPHELKADYAWQVRAYMRFFWRETGVRPARGVVLTIDPSTLAESWYPIELTDEHVQQIDDEEAAVAELIRRRELRFAEYPERPCEAPEDGRSRFCKMVGACFQDWQPNEQAELTDPAIVRLAGRLARAAERKRKAEAEAKRAATIVKTLQGKLADAVPPKTPVTAGGVELKRIEIAGRRTLDLGSLEKSGVVDADVLAPFVSEGDGHSRWTVKTSDATVLAAPVCVCGHELDDHDPEDESGPCQVADCGCEAWEDDDPESSS